MLGSSSTAGDAVHEGSCGIITMAPFCARSVSRMSVPKNKHKGKYCANCKRQRNLVWDPEHKLCYDCLRR